ncbi:hypothetical protein DFJ74DRAFT_663000 [Hyaloraphidium curvatum]|nr:hypothetical protein DFJ74DRAFT_663000 [Hyaloraphidium curvatum]
MLYRAKSLYDYDGTAAGPDNLTLAEDMVVTVTKEDGDWLFGTDPAGKEGWFPASYIEKLPEGGSASPVPPTPLPPGAGAPPVEGTAYLCKATVLADFSPASAEELAVAENEVVGIVEKLEDGWWMAEKLTADRKRGLVPATYCEEIPDTGGQGVAGKKENDASAAIALATSASAAKVVDPAVAAKLAPLNDALTKELRAKEGLEKMLQQPSIPKEAVQAQLAASTKKIDDIQRQIAALTG